MPCGTQQLTPGTTRLVLSHRTVVLVSNLSIGRGTFEGAQIGQHEMHSYHSTRPIHSFSNMNMAGMSTATFQNDKGTILPIAHFPTGPASQVYSSQDRPKIASPNPLYVGVDIAHIHDGD
jgi:hypothetical protein